jgi:hypothetical protein
LASGHVASGVSPRRSYLPSGSIAINRFVCHDTRSPCDDRLPNGSVARPDGTHYSDAAGAPLVRRIVASAVERGRMNPAP